MIESLKKENIEFLENVKLKNYSTIKCDANAKIIIFPKNIIELRKVIKLCKIYDKQFFIIGNGSNLVFLKNNYVFIKLNKICGVKKQGNFLVCGAGANLLEVCKIALNFGLSGLEELYGIPASIAGACVMNARAFGTEIGKVVNYVKCLNSSGKIVKYNKDQCDFAYKQSIFQKNKLAIVEVCISLRKKSNKYINSKMQKFLAKRIASQPKGFSAGCIFKNCHCVIAGKAIDSLGLGGLKFRNFEISKKHCNFILNNGKGKGDDLKILIEKIKRKVYNKSKINLEEEVIFVGEK